MPPAAELLPDNVVGDGFDVHVDEEMAYSHILSGTGEAAGESENSPPYRNSESYVDHR